MRHKRGNEEQVRDWRYGLGRGKITELQRERRDRHDIARQMALCVGVGDVYKAV